MAEERTLDLTHGWRVGPEFIGGWPVYLPDGRHFATVSRAPGIDAEQCARQMAAAPDLLAALEEIVARNEIQHWFNLDQARAAIKRAMEG